MPGERYHPHLKPFMSLYRSPLEMQNHQRMLGMVRPPEDSDLSIEAAIPAPETPSVQAMQSPRDPQPKPVDAVAISPNARKRKKEIP